MRGNLLTAVVGVVTDMLVQPVGDAVFDYLLSPLAETLTGAPAMTMEEIRRQEQLRIKNEQEVALMDAENERIYQQRLEDAAAPIREGEAPDAPILPPEPSESLVDASEQLPRHVPRTHSQSSSEDSRNREYLIRRAALGDNPTQEEMDAVRDYGLEQHKKNFPHLYA